MTWRWRQVFALAIIRVTEHLDALLGTPLEQSRQGRVAADRECSIGQKPKPLIEVDGTTVITQASTILKAFGTNSDDFANGLISQLVNIGSPGKVPDQKGTSFVAAIVAGIDPTDQIEAMLAAQMAAVHNATMTFARRLAHCDTLAQQDSAERAFNKLARTFATQVEALKRYRTGGQQHVTVKHDGQRRRAGGGGKCLAWGAG